MTQRKQKQIIRQGDVLLVARTRPRPPRATQVPRDRGRVVVAYGEVTGHAHALLDEGVVLWEDGEGGRVLQVDRLSSLLHEEHATLVVAPGQYDVVIQREYSPEAIRQVAD